MAIPAGRIRRTSSSSAGGAFAGLDKIISARTQATSMGFGANVRSAD